MVQIIGGAFAGWGVGVILLTTYTSPQTGWLPLLLIAEHSIIFATAGALIAKRYV